MAEMYIQMTYFVVPRGADNYIALVYNHQYLHLIFKLKPHLGSVRLRWIRYYESVCGMNTTGSLPVSQDRNLMQYCDINNH